MGKFQVKAAGKGVMFNLLATNGQVVATSEVYNKKDSLKRGIASVQANAPVAGVEDQTAEKPARIPNPKFEVYADKAGKFKMLDDIIMKETYGIGFKKGNDALAAEVWAVYQAMLADGTVDKIAAEYKIDSVIK